MATARRPTAVISHTPLRPLWCCRACAAPWPCGPARLALLREYAHDRVVLLIHLGGLLHEAAGQLHTLDPHDEVDPKRLFDRFLGWAVTCRSVDRIAETRSPYTQPPRRHRRSPSGSLDSG